MRKKELTEDLERTNEQGLEEDAFLKYIFTENSETGEKVLKSIELSDDSRKGMSDCRRKIIAAFKRTTGSDNLEVANAIIEQIAWGMKSEDSEKRRQLVNMLLHSLCPKDESEGLLLGQFLALQDSGMDCLRNANHNEMFYHKKHDGLLA